MHVAFFIVFLLAPLGYGWFLVRKQRLVGASTSWHKTNGIVRDIAVGDDPDASASVAIRYDYAVDGKTYSGSRVRFFDTYRNKAATNEVTERYRPGVSVTVYYDPANPQQAVLDRRGFGWSDVHVLTLPALSLLFAIFILRAWLA